MFEKDIMNIRSKIVKWVANASSFLKQQIDDRTPEDTKKLVGNNELIPVTRSWSITRGGVINRTPYAAYVEFGVYGKEYRYNKPKWFIFYKGVGARMYTRAKDDSDKQVRDIIAEALQ